MYSLVIPVFKNEATLPELLECLCSVHNRLENQLQVIFVVDASPDGSFALLRDLLALQPYPTKLLLLSRNFGSFAAVRAGMLQADGPYFMVMAADLQEPPELAVELFTIDSEEPVDVVIGTRRSRDDGWLNELGSKLFWACYRKWVVKDIPVGGVDLFACNQIFRDQLLALKESNSSLIGLIFWLGFRRKFVPYDRRARVHGKSAWTFSKKMRYLADSVFAFSDLPIRLLILAGILGLLVSTSFSIVILTARVSGLIRVPGYAGTVLTVLFFAGLNSFGLGVLGSYVWRTFENTKNRPESVVATKIVFPARNRKA